MKIVVGNLAYWGLLYSNESDKNKGVSKAKCTVIIFLV